MDRSRHAGPGAVDAVHLISLVRIFNISHQEKSPDSQITAGRLTRDSIRLRGFYFRIGFPQCARQGNKGRVAQRKRVTIQASRGSAVYT